MPPHKNRYCGTQKMYFSIVKLQKQCLKERTNAKPLFLYLSLSCVPVSKGPYFVLYRKKKEENHNFNLA